MDAALTQPSAGGDAITALTVRGATLLVRAAIDDPTIGALLERHAQLLASANDDAYDRLVIERTIGASPVLIVIPRGIKIAGKRGSAPSLPPGITPKQAFIWRRIARVPEDLFQRWVTETRAAGRELTTGGLLKLYEDLQSKSTTDQDDSAESEMALDDDGRLTHHCQACGARFPCNAGRRH